MRSIVHPCPFEDGTDRQLLWRCFLTFHLSTSSHDWSSFPSWLLQPRVSGEKGGHFRREFFSTPVYPTSFDEGRPSSSPREEGRVWGSTAPRGGIRQPYESSGPRTSSAHRASISIRSAPNYRLELHFKLRWRRGGLRDVASMQYPKGLLSHHLDGSQLIVSQHNTGWIHRRTGWCMGAPAFPSPPTVDLWPAVSHSPSSDGQPKDKRMPMARGGRGWRVSSYVHHTTGTSQDVGVRWLDTNKLHNDEVNATEEDHIWELAIARS